MKRTSSQINNTNGNFADIFRPASGNKTFSCIKMFLFPTLFVLISVNLPAQTMPKNPKPDIYDYLSVCITGVKPNLVHDEVEAVEKNISGRTIPAIFLQKDHFGFPSIFFLEANKKIVVGDAKETAFGTNLVPAIRELFREFLLSISLFNYLIEKLMIPKHDAPQDLANRNLNTTGIKFTNS
jgi:hypothetical protein